MVIPDNTGIADLDACDLREEINPSEEKLRCVCDDRSAGEHGESA